MDRSQTRNGRIQQGLPAVRTIGIPGALEWSRCLSVDRTRTDRRAGSTQSLIPAFALPPLPRSFRSRARSRPPRSASRHRERPCPGRAGTSGREELAGVAVSRALATAVDFARVGRQSARESRRCSRRLPRRSSPIPFRSAAASLAIRSPREALRRCRSVPPAPRHLASTSDTSDTSDSTVPSARGRGPVRRGDAFGCSPPLRMSTLRTSLDERPRSRWMELGARMSRPGRAIDPTIAVHEPAHASLRPSRTRRCCSTFPSRGLFASVVEHGDGIRHGAFDRVGRVIPCGRAPHPLHGQGRCRQDHDGGHHRGASRERPAALVVSADPAHSLGDVLDVRLGSRADADRAAARRAGDRRPGRTRAALGMDPRLPGLAVPLSGDRGRRRRRTGAASRRRGADDPRLCRRACEERATTT